MVPRAPALLLLVLALWLAPPMSAEPVREDFGRLVKHARQALEAGQVAEAHRLLDQAEAARPGALLVAYYRAYCYYREGRFPLAVEGFQAALRLAPEDGWSGYMLGLSLARAGRTAEARARLQGLQAAHAGDELGRSAARALEELAGLERATPGGGAPGPWGAVVEAGAFADSNPAFQAESATGMRMDAAASASLLLERRLVQAGRHRLALGLGVGESAYLARRAPTDWTSFTAWAGYRWSGSVTTWLATLRTRFSLFGYDPFTSVHTAGGGWRWSQAAWTMTLVDLEGLLRLSHDPDYAYLAARGLGLILAQEFEPAPGVRLRAGASLRYEDADAVSAHFEDTATDQAGAQHLLTADYDTDFTFLGYGPNCMVRLPLGPEWSLQASAELGWRRFPVRDQVLQASDGTPTGQWRKARRDLSIRTEGGLKWAFARQWAVQLSAAYLRNLSTLGDADDDPVDRNYSRLTVGLWLRWALNQADR